MSANISPLVIARACKMARDLRDKSWVRNDKHPRGGRYGVNYTEAAEAAVVHFDLDPAWAGLIYGMISSEFCEPSDWWNARIDAAL